MESVPWMSCGRYSRQAMIEGLLLFYLVTVLVVFFVLNYAIKRERKRYDEHRQLEQRLKDWISRSKNLNIQGFYLRET